MLIAQISDSHLFAQPEQLHHGANVYQNLLSILMALKANSAIDYIFFTGDLSQDHSHASYQLFAQAIAQCQIDTPVYFLAGNHDDPALLYQYLTASPFCQESCLSTDDWQLLLLPTKSDSPAGYISADSFTWLKNTIDVNKSQLLFLHHHPVKVNYFIDQHGLLNADEFWLALAAYPSIKAIACGHVHHGLTLLPKDTQRSVPVYTCPATSVQFDPQLMTMKIVNKGPGYRLFSLTKQGTISTEVRYLS